MTTVNYQTVLFNSMLFCLPVLNQGDINGTPRAARPQIEGSWRPQQSNAIGCVVGVEWGLFEEGFHILRKLKLLIVIRQRFLTLSWDLNKNFRAS